VIYHVIPWLYCRINREAIAIRFEIQPGGNQLNHTSWRVLKSAVGKIRKRFVRAGFDNPNKFGLYLVVLSAPVLLCAAAATAAGKPGWLITASCVLTVSVENIVLDRLAKIRKAAFDTALYKIYRFIDMQLNAGLALTAIVSCLPEAVNDKKLQPVLRRMSAAFRLSGDLARSLQELEYSFAGQETVLLGNHLRQCMQTGVAGTSFTRMESLLFTRHLSNIKANSDRLQMELLLSVALASIPLLMITLYPLFIEFAGAYQSLFG
jgi:hypothetical protein